jgi:hypothetical protein
MAAKVTKFFETAKKKAKTYHKNVLLHIDYETGLY